MNKLTGIFAAILLMFQAAHGQNTKELSAFSGIVIQSMANITIVQGTTHSILVPDEGVMRSIETNVRNNTLYVDGVGGDIVVTAVEISKLAISGKGKITSQNKISTDQLDIDISGDGKIVLDVQANQLKAKIGGLGKLELSGSATNTDFLVSGSGKIDAFDLKSKNCKATISGVGVCNIDVSDNLTTNISGTGKVNYKTEPANVENNISGLGKVNQESSMGSGRAEKDTTCLSFGETKVLFVSPRDSTKKSKSNTPKPIWAGIELGLNNYVDKDGKTSLPNGYDFLELNSTKSVSFALNLFQKNIRFGKSSFFFFTGLGFLYNNYRFDDNVILDGGQNTISGIKDTTDGRSYDKSKLTVNYLTAPVMFEVFTSRNKKHAFHIGVGGTIAMRIGSHTKLKYKDGSGRAKPKEYDDYHLNPFRYGPRVALGYGGFNVAVDYAMSTLFKDSEGPSLYPVSVAITLASF